MKAFYRTVLYGEYAGASQFHRTETSQTLWEVKLLNVDFCCKKMEEAFYDHYVGFGEYDSTLNKEATINIFHSDHFPEGCSTDSLSIEYCPFCGAKIECIEQEKAELKKKIKITPAKEETIFEEEVVKDERQDSKGTD